MKRKNKLADKDLILLNQLAEECYDYIPFGNYSGYMTLMSDIVKAWPKRKLTSSKQSEDALKFGFYTGFLSAQMFFQDVTKEKKIIKDFLKADKTAQDRLKQKLEREILEPDYTTGI
ncbi:MAG: hypothetical protein QGH26_03960 [Candidatus Pacebacteria bacterium]|jgi:hypothetical protein|nr:hypothetical protein [Candidatus Paceibacterota bacterium]|tara:strand:+ start:4516 stop:4866 length:351 start_codon:yes stop_codon:yes gene_type:complete